MIIKTRLWHNT